MKITISAGNLRTAPPFPYGRVTLASGKKYTFNVLHIVAGALALRALWRNRKANRGRS